MDYRKGPDIYFQENEQTRQRTLNGVYKQDVDLNDNFKDNHNYNMAKPQLYSPDYVEKYNTANRYYKQNNDDNLYSARFNTNLATSEDLFVKPKTNNLELLASMLKGGNATAPEPSFYREIKESRSQQSSLAAMNSMRGDSSYLKR